MTGGRSRPIRLLLLLFVSALGLALCVPLALQTERGRRLAGGLVRMATGYELRAGRLELVAGPGLAFTDVTLVAPGSHTPLLEARSGRVALARGGNAGGGLLDLEVEIDGFAVDLSATDAAARGVRESSPQRRDAGSWQPLPLARVRAVDGTVRWRGPDGAANVLVDEILLGRSLAAADARGGPAHEELDRLAPMATRGRLRLPSGAGRVEWRGRYFSQDGRVELDVEAALPELSNAAAVLGVAVPDLGGVLGATARGQVRGDLRRLLTADLDAELTGDAPLSGASAEMRGRHDVGADETRADVSIVVGPDLPPLTGRVTLAGRPGAGSRGELTLAWSDAPLGPLARRVRPWLRVERAEGELELAVRAVSDADGFDASVSAALSSASLSVAGLDVAGAIRADLGYDGATLAVRSGGLVASNVRVRGDFGTASAAEVAVVGSVRAADGEPLVVVEELRVDGLSASDPSWTRALDGAALRGRGALRLGDAAGTKVTARLELLAGEALWGRAYAPIGDMKPSVELEAVRRGDDVNVRRLDGAIGGIGEFESELVYEVGSGLRTATLELDVPGLARAFEILVREPLAKSWPTMAGSSVGGHLTGELTWTGEPERARVAGRLEVASGRVVIDRGRSTIDGVNLVLPVNLSTDGGAYGGSQAGRISFAGMHLRGVDVPRVELPLRVRTNEISGAASVDVPLLGGAVALGDVRVRGLAGADRSASMWLTARDVDLASLATAVGLPAAVGRFDATFTNVRAAASEITTEGGLRLSVLGGVVEVAGLKVTDIGTRVARVHADVDARGIDLGEATAALGVGRIEGIVDAHVEGLEIVDGQAVRFDAEIASVPTRGVKQRISVAAIEQLSILGGAAASPVTQTVLGFFDEYRYAKMGARCSLRKDRFVLRGVERYEQKDFLVVGTFMPPTVNVVSHNQVIAFNEMVRRLGRIGQAAGRGRGDDPR